MSDTWQRMIASRAHSDAPAVVTDGHVWSGAELLGRASGASAFLDAADAPRGQPVVALLTSHADAFALTIGAAATDRPLAALGPRLTLAELTPIAAGLPGDLIVAEAEFAALGQELADRTDRRLAVLDGLTPVDQPLPIDVAADRPAAILHTSGTTGRPKAVAYTQGRLAERVRVNAALVDLGPGAVYASASPFHHIAGLGMLFVAMGSGAALRPLSKFDLATWQGLAGSGVTHALVVPTMIEQLLAADALHLPGLRVLQYGASPIRPQTLARAMAALPGVRFVNIFGQTEGSPITCLTMDDHERAARDRPDLLASVGRPAPGVELVIDSPGPDGVGEVWARAKHLFKPDADGWLRTGDFGRVDEDGYLYLSGRRGDKIIRGGENVYPLEVEHVLAGHPAVAEACVFGRPDAVYGEVVAAALVRRPHHPRPSDDELRRFARARLAGFKVPTQWAWVDALPRNASSKVVRHALAKALEASGPNDR